MRNTIAASLVLILVSLSFSQDIRRDALVTLGMTEITTLKDIPDILTGPIICLAVAEEGSDPKFVNGGLRVGVVEEDVISFGGSTFKADGVYVAKDDKGKSVVVIYAKHLIMLWYDVQLPALNNMGITKMIQIINLDKNGKSSKLFVR